jgi:hypothetical protein
LEKDALHGIALHCSSSLRGNTTLRTPALATHPLHGIALHISATQAQNATELENLGFCTTNSQNAAIKLKSQDGVLKNTTWYCTTYLGRAGPKCYGARKLGVLYYKQPKMQQKKLNRKMKSWRSEMWQ